MGFEWISEDCSVNRMGYLNKDQPKIRLEEHSQINEVDG